MPPKKAALKVVGTAPPAKRARNATSSASSVPPVKSSKAAAGASVHTAGGPRVDEQCNLSGQVYLDAGGVAWSVKLNQTNIGHNNNKYYIIQLIEVSASSYACFTRWGRVGEPGQQATFTGGLDAAQAQFASKFKDKTKNNWDAVKDNHSAFTSVASKYDLVETEASEGDTSAAAAAGGGGGTPHSPTAAAAKVKPSKLDKDMQSMLTLIFDEDMFNKQMKEKNIDANRMPLGKLTKGQLDRGYAALEQIENLLGSGKKKGGASSAQLAELSSTFYTIIPHDFGRNVPPTISTLEMVKDKYDLLDMLGDIQIAVALDRAAATKKVEENPIDKKYKELDCRLATLDPKSKEYSMITKYTEETQGYRKCKVRRIFTVDRPEDKKRMDSKHGKETEGRFLLWHGTNIAVVAAILKTGLRIMPHAGGRVGRGLYFASENGKSSGYVGCHGKTGIMFLVEVCMGDSVKRILSDDSSLNSNKVNGYKATSVLACGRNEPDHSKSIQVKGEWGQVTVPQSKAVPQNGCEKSSFMQSEYLVYEESRARIKYLIEMEF